MNAEPLIKTRKVFVEDKIVEYSETCPICASNGIDNKLRYYYISMDEAIYKCSGARCLYPFNRFIFKSLKDNSLYYYEEVLDNGPEAMFQVSLDGPNDYQLSIEESTELFCDSQRNSDIENYDYDFLDLLKDFETEPKQELVSKSTTDNLDFLAFLDEITVPTKVDTDNVLDKNGINSMIANLPASPIKNATTTKVKSGKNIKSNEKVKIKTEAKLTKCIHHIEKSKSSKNKKTNKKPVNTFSMAIRKVRKSQAKAKVDPSSVNDALQTKEVVPRPTQELPKQEMRELSKLIHTLSIQ